MRAWRDGAEEAFPQRLAALLSDDEPSVYGLHEHAGGAVRVFFRAATGGLSASDAGGVHVAGILSDDAGGREAEGFDRVWGGFLRLYNLFQFLPHASFVSGEGVASGAYDGVDWSVAPFGVASGDPASPNDEAAWSEARELTEPEAHALLGVLAEAGWPVPEVGYELVGADGAVAAEAELAWPARRVALVHEDHPDGLEAFEQQGWEASPLADAVADPDLFADTERFAGTQRFAAPPPVRGTATPKVSG